MKKFFPLGCVAVVAFSAAEIVRAEDVATEALANESRVWDSFVGPTPDTKAFERLVAPGYLCIEATGVLMNAAENVAQLRSLTFSSYKIQDPQVRRLSSNSVLIVARVRFEGTAYGQKMSGETLTSTVWIHHRNKWLAQLHTETFLKR